MYIQSLDQPDGLPTEQELAAASQGEADLQARFDTHTGADQKIEPQDWTSAPYHKTPLRQIPQYAHSEVVGMLPEDNWISRTPSLKRGAILLARVQDGASHGPYLYSAAGTFGSSRDKMIDVLHEGRAEYPSILNYPTLPWADAGVIGWLVDGAAIMNQVPLCRCSYGPYVRVMIHICREKSFHQRQDYESLLAMMGDTQMQHDVVQETVDRWWFPVSMMFGPPDIASSGSTQAMAWGIKHISNDDLRQRFIDATVKQARAFGVTLSDPGPIRNEARGRYDFSPLDWSEFKHMLDGHDPCNHERLATRRYVHEKGEWVREVVLAHARKQTQHAAVSQQAV